MRNNSLPQPIALNNFQRLMLLWSLEVPYNGTHIIEIPGKPDHERWQSAIIAAFNKLNLGNPHFLQNKRKVIYTPITSIPIETPSVTLEEHLNNELNVRFALNDVPLRFFLLPATDSTYHFGLTYNHWFADSQTLRSVFHHIFDQYQTNCDSKLPPLIMRTLKFNNLFRKHIGWLPALRTIGEFFRNYLIFSCAYRLPVLNEADFHSHIIYRTFPDGLINKLHAYAKNYQASVNDVFLSAMAKVMGEFTVNDRAIQKPKALRKARNQIALGTIVDIRHASKYDLKGVFGLYLGNYTVVLAQPEKLSASQLLSSIVKQTVKIKNRFTAVKNCLTFSVGTFLFEKFTKPKLRLQFFHKNGPIAAGISNLNVTNSWLDKSVLKYIRTSPVGPLLPLAFSLTTTGKRLSLCMMYRTTIFSDQQAQVICDQFINCLESYVKDLPN